MNVAWCSFAYFFKLSKSAPAPFILSLELWNECNAGCLFCRDAKGVIYDINPAGGGKGNVSKGKMPPEMAEDIIKQVKDRSLIAVLYTNGEPLLYKDLGRVVKTATENKMATMMTSLQSSFTSLSISSNSSFLGQRLLSPISLSAASPVTPVFEILVLIKDIATFSSSM